MQVGEQNLPVAQLFILNFLRLFDFNNHLALGKNFRSRRFDLRTRRLIHRIVRANALSRLCFHPNFVAMRDQFTDVFRNQPDAVFIIFNLLRYPDTHNHLL